MMSKKKQTKGSAARLALIVPSKVQTRVPSKRSNAEFPQKQGTLELQSKIGYKQPPKQYQFTPGKSGNPSGLPKGTPRLSVAYRTVLASQPSVEFKPKNRAEEIAISICARALSGDVKAAKEIADRTEGKAPATINVNRDDIMIERYYRLAEDLAAKYGKPLEQVVRDIIERDPEAARYF